MKDTWPTVKLKDICEQITDGKHGDCEDEPGSGFYFLSAKDILDGQLLYQNARQITESDFVDTHRRTRLEPYDILLTNSGTIGRMALAPDEERTLHTTFQKSVAILKPRRSVVGPHFLYYLLLYDNKRLTDFAGGTAQKNLLLRDMRAFPVHLPPLPIQERMAAILSAYDDLIENNTRRIKILEEMARTIYREWFVNFHFPGHERVKMVESKLGPIPEGWAVAKMRDIIECRRDTTEAGDHLEGRQYVPIDCIPRNTLTLLEAKPWEEAQSSLHTFEEGDILFGAMRAYFHKVIVAPFKGVTRSTCFVLRPYRKEEWPFAALTLFQDETVKFAAAHARGTTIPYAVWDGSLAEMSLRLPPRSLLLSFDQAVRPMLQLLLTFFARQSNLRCTRDLLLPKLISGELDVSELEINTSNLDQ